MTLETYRQRRNFARSLEPRGSGRRGGGEPRFVVQKHAAQRLHYDLRLELDGVLKSWAIPKGPSLRPADRRLAVHVEDHPIEYADFEGTIPEGEYGGGTVIIWDRGAWRPLGDARQQYQRGKLTFELSGEKLRGRRKLVRVRGESNGASKNWLLIKDRDPAAIADDQPQPVDTMPASVKSGRTLEQLSSNGGPEERRASAGKRVSQAATAGERDWPPEARLCEMPHRVIPQLATLVDSPPAGDDWIHEIKFDGYRLVARIDQGEVHLLTRSGKDWTVRFPKLAEAALALPLDQAWLDGEIVVRDAEGGTSFAALQQAIADKQDHRMAYFLFDLLYLDGHDLRPAPLVERKRMLRALVDGADREALQYSDHIKGRGDLLYEQACRHWLEGIISKRAAAAWRAGRSSDWLKTKCLRRQEFAILGYTDPGGSREGFGALLMGYRDEDHQWIYAGKVGAGFTQRALKDLHGRLEAIGRERIPNLRNAPTGSWTRKAHWVHPRLLAEVQFSGLTDAGLIRHGTFLGLRQDKLASEARLEKPMPSSRLLEAFKTPAKTTDVVSGVRLTHPHRVLYPEGSITKAQLADYYRAVAARMLPHIADRPLAIVRCPKGTDGKCFFQRNLGAGLPQPISSVEVESDGQRVQHLCIHDAAGLVALVQISALEMHPWNCRSDRLNRPDRLIFDLDPGEDVAWPSIVDAAQRLRAVLQEVDLTCFAKTSGGKGLHVVVPIQRRRSFDDAKTFTHAVAKTLAQRHPREFVAVMTKSKRRGRIYVDYLRNDYGATAIAPYSTRRRSGAPVSMPLRWDELTDDLRPERFNVLTVPPRLDRSSGDPWEDYFKVQQSITRRAERHFGASR